MNIRKGIVSLGAIAGVLFAGSTRRAVGVVPHSLPRQAVSIVRLKPQPLLDSVRFNTLQYMDDAPVLPSFKNKK